MKKMRLVFGMTLLAMLGGAKGDDLLWNAGSPQGQWRAFGAGMLQASAEGNGLALQVDWTKTTFGVGAVFAGSAEMAFPKLEGVRTLTLEAKAAGSSGTVLAPEWVLAGGGKTSRVAEESRAALTGEWQMFSFRVPDDFPGLAKSGLSVTGFRLLFMNPDKSGRAQLSFRDVRLAP